jgi:6,7-dimethyl-8-ribityllumazine synthase
MATILKNLSAYDTKKVPKAKDMRFGIVVSEWNEEITKALCLGAVETLMYHKVKAKNITVKYVPGSFELTLGAQIFLDYTNVDAVICLGCVIQGETRHFEFICNAVADGIMKLNTDYSMPVIFGVLTTDTLEQAKDRAGGKHGNKGTEAAITAIKMIALQHEMISKFNPPQILSVE